MRTVIQRVSSASVEVSEEIVGEIGKGLLVLVGVEASDTIDDVEWLVRKLVHMRIFSDQEGKMNLSLLDINGSMLIISQFTLHASTKKGNRPSYIRAARPDIAILLYEAFVERVREEGVVVATGRFGADMRVALVNSGPVTIIMDSKDRQ